MIQDNELLQCYAGQQHSESAFSELIHRYVNLIYSAAIRLMNGDVHRAEDVTQQVFAELARQAKHLSNHPTVAGWLYTTTRRMALRATRTEQRRKSREKEATLMDQLLGSGSGESQPEWEQLRPVLDDAMQELNDKDRLAVLLRFFQNKTHREVGSALGLGENAARMRVERALEKLRFKLARKGVHSTAALLGSTLAAHAVTAAPGQLVTALASTSFAGVTATTVSSLLKALTMANLKAPIAATIALASVATSLVIQHHARTQLRQSDAISQQQASEVSAAKAENARLARLLAQTNATGTNDRADLTRLRAESAALPQSQSELASLQEENRRLKINKSHLFNPSKTILELREEALVKMNVAKQWVLAFILFANNNGGQYPASFDQAASFFPDPAQGDTNSPADQFEIVYQGPIKNITNGNMVIVFREKQAQQFPDGKWARAYGFADGHSEIHSSPDGNFEAWEKQRLLPPSPSTFK